METVTPRSSMRRSLKSQQGKNKKGGKKCSNPFLDADAVLNPFISYERSFVRVLGSESTASSRSVNELSTYLSNNIYTTSWSFLPIVR